MQDLLKKAFQDMGLDHEDNLRLAVEYGIRAIERNAVDSVVEKVTKFVRGQYPSLFEEGKKLIAPAPAAVPAPAPKAPAPKNAPKAPAPKPTPAPAPAAPASAVPAPVPAAPAPAPAPAAPVVVEQPKEPAVG